MEMQITQNDQKKKAETVALIRNRVYKTYQFYGILGRNKDPEMVLKVAVSELFQWLSERFRQHDQIPSQIKLPEDPSRITDSHLASFRIDDGYIIETVWIPEKSIWAFQLTEPDMGTTNRPSVPGRVFLTNYGICITGDMVEFGCQTVCSEPEITEKEAEVFRPKVIRTLRDKLGLFAGTDLDYQAILLTEPSGLKRWKTVLADPHRNLPVLVMEAKSPEPCVIKPEFRPASLLNTLPSIAPAPTQNLRQFADRWAKTLCGYATLFLNDQSTQNMIRIQFPGDGKTIEYPFEEFFEEHAIVKLEQKINDLVMNFPKRKESLYFGNVKLLGEALEIRQQLELERLQESNDLVAQVQTLQSANRDLTQKLRKEEQHCREFADLYQKERDQNQAANHTLTVAKNMGTERLEQLQKEARELARQVDSLQEENRILRARVERPTSIRGFLDWAEDSFGAHVQILSRAREELKNEANPKIRMYCDAIEVLALDYKPYRLGEITEEEFKRRSRSRGDSAFTITLSGEASVQRFSEKYKVKYDGHGSDPNGRRTLDLHLKHGVDPQHLIRAYFFWDEAREKVVIGSMPGHLPVV